MNRLGMNRLGMNWLGRVGLRLRLEVLIRKNSELHKLEIPSAGGGPVGCGGFGAAEPQVPDRGTRPLLSEHEFAARGAANRASSAAALSGAGGEGSPKGRLRLAAAHRPTAGLKNSDKHFPPSTQTRNRLKNSNVHPPNLQPLNNPAT